MLLLRPQMVEADESEILEIRERRLPFFSLATPPRVRWEEILDDEVKPVPPPLISIRERDNPHRRRRTWDEPTGRKITVSQDQESGPPVGRIHPRTICEVGVPLGDRNGAVSREREGGESRSGR